MEPHRHPLMVRFGQEQPPDALYPLARGEVGECAAALELAGRLGLAAPLEVAGALTLADRVGAMLTRLVRRFGG